MPNRFDQSRFDFESHALNQIFASQAWMEMIFAQQRDFQAQMDKLLAPQRYLEKHMEMLMAPLRNLQTQIAIIQAPQRILQEQMDRLAAPEIAFRERMKTLLGLQYGLPKQLEKLLEPQRILEEMMKGILRPQNLLFDQMSSYMRSIGPYYADPLLGTVRLGQNGIIAVGNDIVDIDVVQNELTEFAMHANSVDLSFEEFANWLKLLEPKIRCVVLYVVLPILINIFSNLISPTFADWLKCIQHLQPKEALKEINRQAIESYSKEYLVNYRLVGAKSIIIYTNCSHKSKQINELRLGKIVRIIKQKKQWSLVEYVDERTDCEETGWTFSRYLFKFAF